MKESFVYLHKKKYKQKRSIYYFPYPTPPNHYSSLCRCVECSIFTMIMFDETLQDYGNDKMFKRMCKSVYEPILKENCCPCSLFSLIDDEFDTMFTFLCAHIHDPST